jgi:hypothetical protein
MANDNKQGVYGASWLSLLAYSVIALVALLWEVDKVSDETGQNKWTVASMSISVAFSGLAVIASFLMKSKFSGTHIEGGLVRIRIIMFPNFRVVMSLFARVRSPASSHDRRVLNVSPAHLSLPTFIHYRPSFS